MPIVDFEERILNHAQSLASTRSFLHLALQAAFKASEVFPRHSSLADLEVYEKSGERGLVTAADKAAEKVIREFLRAETAVPILGEEEGLSGGSSERLWVVDPIDGTTNFSRGIPLSAIAIGLLERGELSLGVVYNPFLAECFYAEAGRGAYLNAERIEVNAGPIKGKPLVFVNSGYAPEFELCAQDLSERLRGRVLHRHFGTTALEICYVASGRAEAFTSIGDELWDYVAAASIAKEAGAVLRDWENAEWTTNRSDFLVATPAVMPLFQPEIHQVYQTHCGKIAPR